uniref:DDT domain-containing protein n=1 Tax=Globodera pallida TaxID=36090 RepID=A0A183CQ19_GLOPA
MSNTNVTKMLHILPSPQHPPPQHPHAAEVEDVRAGAEVVVAVEFCGRQTEMLAQHQQAVMLFGTYLRARPYRVRGDGEDDSASVASSTGKRGKSTKVPRQPPAAAAKTKRPWEGSEDDEDDSKRYGFGRSFLFSEEEDYEEDEEENDELESDLTESDSDAEGDPKAVPSSSAPFAYHPDYEEDEEDFLAELSPEQIPPLILSDSSVDLLIYKEHLMDTLEVYEVLKNYGSILQLSPFLFEDFCAAIRSPKQSRLLCEIHLAFMRLFFREEESEHTIFAATETTVSVNIIVHLMDSMNFAEVLRHYVESDPLFPADVLHILESSNYPFVELDKRLRVLKWMCERFFEFDLIKRIVGGINKTKHDEQCRSCSKMGGGLASCWHVPSAMRFTTC